MSKVTLINTETGKPQEFQPVDAREVLSRENTIYRVPEAGELAGGDGGQAIKVVQGEPMGGLEEGVQTVRVTPNLGNSDTGTMTGLSETQYTRQAVDKSEPGQPKVSAAATRTRIAAEPEEPAKMRDITTARDTGAPIDPAKAQTTGMGGLTAGAAAAGDQKQAPRREQVDTLQSQDPTDRPEGGSKPQPTRRSK